MKKRKKTKLPEWHKALDEASDDLSHGKTEGFESFLSTHTSRLNTKDLLFVRSCLIPKVRNKAKGVLGGAALKGHAKRVKGLFQELQSLIDASKEAKKKENEPKLTPKEIAEHKKKVQEHHDTLADMHLAYVESSETLEDLGVCLHNLLSSGRFEIKQHSGSSKKGYTAYTDYGYSGLPEVNFEVNGIIFKAYQRKKRELFAKEEENKKVQAILKEDRERENAHLKARKDAQMSGVFEEVKVDGVKLRIYIGYSKRGKRIIRIDQVEQFGKRGKNKPKFSVGAAYQIDANNVPYNLKGIAEGAYSRFVVIDAKIAAEEKAAREAAAQEAAKIAAEKEAQEAQESEKLAA